MTACKDNRSTGKTVLVDFTKDNQQGLPENVQAAFNGAGNTWPKAVITDPAMTKIYGTYSFAALRPQEYRKLFRDATRAFDDDADAGVLTPPGGKPEAAAELTEEDPTPDFEPTEFEKWKSSKGSVLEARLVAIDGKGQYVFEDRNGRKISVAPDQLDLDSRTRAKAAVSGG